MDKPYPFFWYELMTNDMAAAESFYRAVVGWQVSPFSGNPDKPYTVLEAGGRGIGGIMAIPEEAHGMPPGWVGYIHVPDTDAACEAIKTAGGSVWRAPEDIPTVGRFAVVGAPQRAM